MSASASASTFACNVIPVDFRTSPVVVDFAVASAPKSEIAVRLKAEALAQTGKLGSGDKKAGTLRILSAARTDLFNLNPYLIGIKPDWNCRELADPANLDHIDSLARSISKIGVQEALTVVLEGDKVFVTDGHCRLLATFRAIEVYGAEIRSIPLRAETRGSSPADHVLRQLLSGKQKSVLEQGKAFVKLINFGWTPTEIAAKAGNVGAVRVSQILDLMAHANAAIKAMVANGSISASTAAQALRDANNDAEVAEEALTKALKVAVAAGKTRATAKHVNVASGRVSKTKELATIFSAAEVVTEKKLTTVSLPSDDWARVVALLNIG